MMDFLESRSMNLNVRVSPMMKMQLTERVKKLGINITDYVYIAIAKSESMDCDVEQLNAENLKLQQQVKQLQNELKRYEDILEPLAREVLGKEITNAQNQRFLMNNKLDMLSFICSTFEKKEK
ncbi:MAG: hypothetical protein JNL70_09345 [Saprospiraceae bacterium]|nr:hypothetical protein [Saprospiraceae bacterium]